MVPFKFAWRASHSICPSGVVVQGIVHVALGDLDGGQGKSHLPGGQRGTSPSRRDSRSRRSSEWDARFSFVARLQHPRCGACSSLDIRGVNIILERLTVGGSSSRPSSPRLDVSIFVHGGLPTVKARDAGEVLLVGELDLTTPREPRGSSSEGSAWAFTTRPLLV